jgi:DNA topoisomerase-3
MRLFIAEKPSLGRAIAQYLPVAARAMGSPPTHLVCGPDMVSWCFGHLLEPVDPEGYGDEYKAWSFATLPIIPTAWRLEPRRQAAGQIKVLRGLLKDCAEVVHAGDPDREGQLLVDELLEYLGNRKPVRRIWLAALDEASVRKALGDLRDNQAYRGLKAAAEARQRGDWLVGMNLTRAFTLAGRRQGYSGVLSIGRVQTPTLKLVVDRCLAIEGFVAQDYFTVSAAIRLPAGAFTAWWQPGDDVATDAAGRVLDRALAEQVRARVEGREAIVVLYDSQERQQAPPLPYALSGLQAAANRRFGLGAQAVLDLAQALYEAKAISYPRTDCAYLPDSQWAEAPGVLAGLGPDYRDLAAAADTRLRSAAWNDAKVTAHHAIVPTGQPPALRSEPERQVYDLIVRNYLAQFFPPYRYRETRIELAVAGEAFTAAGNTPLSPGWKAVLEEPEEPAAAGDGDTAGAALPVLAPGDAGYCEAAAVVARKTTPPAYFTEGTLIAAMTRIHQWVDDPELKKRLKETAGIGTEATRAGILETLKKRGFMAAKGKQLRDTPAGRQLILALPEAVKSPGLTGLFEQLLRGIEEGTVEPARFLEQQTGFIRKYVALAQDPEFRIAATGAALAGGNRPAAEGIACPQCEQGRLRRIKGKPGHFWGCSRYAEGCKATFPDRRGRPQLLPAHGPPKR